ncbi:DNA internalization-related competence protein ComEC/Rec2 [Vibrio sp. 16]|uniref:DNA internalization-related competence protein ComEC/Rec2 n=1 Tax=Vibrio sp. 16 TaxID=391586 RepID=UPI003A100877
MPCIGLIALSLCNRKYSFLFGLSLACLVVLIHGNLVRHNTDELFKAGSDITINAQVDSFFKQISHGFHGTAVVRSINGEKLFAYEQPTVWVTSPIALSLGQVISSKVSLQPISGQFNETGFDKERYAYAQGILGHAKIKNSSSFWVIDKGSLRERLFQTISAHTLSTVNQGLILALLFGSRDKIPDSVNQQLQHSGLSHLVAISGLHIGIMFSFGWAVGRLLLVASPKMTNAPIFIGAVIAFGYAYLAGFSIPTVRALIMCLLMCSQVLIRTHLSKLSRWLMVLAFLLTLWPQSALDPSLWLSMYAVAAILLFLSIRSTYRHGVVNNVLMQTFIVICMSLPVSVVFGGISISAIGYNLVFVPWFSFVVMPATFIAAVVSLFGYVDATIWGMVDWALSVVVASSAWAGDSWFSLSSQEVTILIVLACFIFMLPWLTRFGIVLFALTFVLVTVSWRPKPDWQLNILDVGHGLAILAVQGERALLYDTGAAWQQSNYAEQLITPLMEAKGIEVLDIVVLSHFDNDHAGGIGEILQRWQPERVIASQPLSNSLNCIVGETWQWGEVEIQALWPPKIVERAYNPHSCVIKLTHKVTKQSVLLTGDIERIAEWMLIRKPDALASNIVIVPHHGSKTSSTDSFIQAANPDLAIASTSYRGRWNLPNQEVVERYRTQGADWIDTGHSGQVVIDFYPSGRNVVQLRESKGQAWYRQMLRKGVE